MKKCILAIYLIIISIAPAKPVDNVRTADMRSKGMGIQGITESIYFNPACSGLLKKKELSLFYYNRFMMKGMSTATISFVYPHSFLTTGIIFSTFGDQLYRDSQLALSLSKKLGHSWSVGINLAYRFLRMKTMEGTPAFFSSDFGITYQPNKKIRVGISLLNGPRISVGNASFRYFTGYSFHAGCSWQIHSSVWLVTEVENNYETPFQGSAGIEYCPFSSFYIRTGIHTDPFQPYGGIGYNFHSITADLAISYHNILGVSTGIGLKISF